MLMACSVSVSHGSPEIKKPGKIYVEKSFVKAVNPADVNDLMNAYLDAERIVFGRFAPPIIGKTAISYTSYHKNLKQNSKSLANLNWKICARHKC